MPVSEKDTTEVCEACGGDKGRYSFDPLGCGCNHQPEAEIWTGKSDFPKNFFEDQLEGTNLDDNALQCAARAIAIEANKDDLPEGGWSAYNVACAEAAIRAYLYAAPPAAVQEPVADLPADIIESLLAIGPVEWGQTHKQNDGKHLDDLEDTLRLTRQHFGIEDKETAIHGLYIAGTGIVLAHTGMSPNSPQHARILAGAWNQFVGIAKGRSALSTSQSDPAPEKVQTSNIALIQALSRLAGNRQSDGASSLVSREDRETIINGCHDLLIASKSTAPEIAALPQDVINLVIAAREAFDTGWLEDQESNALDKALEPFSSRVPYENDPDAVAPEQEEAK